RRCCRDFVEWRIWGDLREAAGAAAGAGGSIGQCVGETMKRTRLAVRELRRRRKSPVGVSEEGRDPSTAYAHSLFANPHTPLRMTISQGLEICALSFLIAISAFGQSASSVNYTVSLAS